jgi:hypothetical protein
VDKRMKPDNEYENFEGFFKEYDKDDMKKTFKIPRFYLLKHLQRIYLQWLKEFGMISRKMKLFMPHKI